MRHRKSMADEASEAGRVAELHAGEAVATMEAQARADARHHVELVVLLLALAAVLVWRRS